MAKRTQLIPIKEAFAKGLIDGHGLNKVPANFAVYSRNHRVLNGSTTTKKGYITRVSDDNGTHIRDIIGNSVTNKLLCCSDSKLKEVDLTNWVLNTIGSIGVDVDVNFINHWKHSIVLTGIGKPRVYDWTTLKQLTGLTYNPAFLTGWLNATRDIAVWSAINNGSFDITINGVLRNVTGINFAWVTSMDDVALKIQTAIRALTSSTETVTWDITNRLIIKSANVTSTSAITVTATNWAGTDISGTAQYLTSGTYYMACAATWGIGIVTNATLSDAPNINPIIGVSFSWFTVIAGNTPESYNFIYFSAPVTPTNPERAYDWIYNWAENRNMWSKVLGMVAGLNNLYIFTQNTVEFVGKDSLATVGSNFSFYSSPIGEWDQLINMDCAVTANDKAFYLTKNFVIKTLNYILGTTDPAVGELSDRPLLSIRNFLDVQLSDNQDDAFAMRKDDKIYWYLKSADSPINNIALVYDVTNDNWYVDDSIYYANMTKFNWKYYAGSCLNSDIIEDDSGYDMDWDGIPFIYKTPNLNFGDPVNRKFFKWWELAGEINLETELTVNTIIDWFVIDSKTIYGKDYVPYWIWVSSIGTFPIGWQPIAGSTDMSISGDLAPFEVVNKHWNINLKGKQLQLEFISNQPNSRFYLDYLAFMVQPIGNYQLQDVL